MTRLRTLKLSYVILALRLLSSTAGFLASDQEKKNYIVYVGNLGESHRSTSSYSQNMLLEVVDTSFLVFLKSLRGQSLVRSYTRSFNIGFSAYLTNEKQEDFARKEEVVSIFPSRVLQPQTTRSWYFMGFHEDANRNPTAESDIIGFIDSGIWPESESFTDKGFSPQLKGVCKGGQNFTCNKYIPYSHYPLNSCIFLIFDYMHFLLVGTAEET
ncbi:Subtilase 4.13 isoform 2 [Dorcoceras hygrometricum]|uniref:Subtilase 4.13 isoform 2 n=1 Tax=Dorcoceras hygrometricum TaxID=472368 RepID=A0A2Z7CD57_9LAMI|nr:Subtilase 4.13 isoform 2 [Dorcoceras hygrometricum]